MGPLGATESELGRTVMAISSVGGLGVSIAAASLGIFATIRRLRPWSGGDDGHPIPEDRALLAPVALAARRELSMTLDEIDQLTQDEIDRLTEDEIEQAAAAFEARERRAEQMRRAMEKQGQRVPRHWDHSAREASDWGQGEGFVLFIVAVPGASLVGAVLVAAFWLLGLPAWIPVVGSAIGVVGGAALATAILFGIAA